MLKVTQLQPDLQSGFLAITVIKWTEGMKRPSPSFRGVWRRVAQKEEEGTAEPRGKPLAPGSSLKEKDCKCGGPGACWGQGITGPSPSLAPPIMASQHMLASTALVTSKRRLDPQCDYCSSTWLCLCRKAFLNAQNYFKKFINSTFYISEFATLKCFSLFLIKNIIP